MKGTSSDIKLGGKDKVGKSSLSIIPFEPTLKVSRVFSYGAKKYGMNNWRKGHLQLDLLDSCLRHVYSHIEGFDIDGESGLSHLSHAAANLFIIMQQIHDKTSVDNRFETISKAAAEEQAKLDAEIEEEVLFADNAATIEDVEDEEEGEADDGEGVKSIGCFGESEVEKYNNQVVSGFVPHWNTDYVKHRQ